MQPIPDTEMSTFLSRIEMTRRILLQCYVYAFDADACEAFSQSLYYVSLCMTGLDDQIVRYNGQLRSSNRYDAVELT
jgi:hypothetical protein